MMDNERNNGFPETDKEIIDRICPFCKEPIGSLQVSFNNRGVSSWHYLAPFTSAHADCYIKHSAKETFKEIYNGKTASGDRTINTCPEK